MNRPLMPLLSAIVFGFMGVWWISQERDAVQTTAIVGHWESPQGGIYFDAVESKAFKLDVMHSFFGGKWESVAPGEWRLQYYDFSGDEPVMNDPTFVGKVILGGQGGDGTIDS